MNDNLNSQLNCVRVPPSAFGKHLPDCFSSGHGFMEVSSLHSSTNQSNDSPMSSPRIAPAKKSSPALAGISAAAWDPRLAKQLEETSLESGPWLFPELLRETWSKCKRMTQCGGLYKRKQEKPACKPINSKASLMPNNPHTGLETGLPKLRRKADTFPIVLQ